MRDKIEKFDLIITRVLIYMQAVTEIAITLEAMNNISNKELKSNTFDEIQLKDQLISIDTHNYEESLDLTGIGRFSHKVLSACSFGLLAVGFQNGLTAYMLPSAKCDLEISTAEMGYINVVFMIGGIMSACLWGVVGNMVGVRKVLLGTLLADSVVTIISSVSENYLMLLIMRFLNGFLIGGPGCLLFTYMGDMIPLKRRTKYLCYMGFCFILSWIILPALAFLIMPVKFDVMLPGDVKFNSWRVYLCVAAIPSIVSAGLFTAMPESPRLLLAKKNKKEALYVLRRMFRVNTGRPDKEYLALHALNCPAAANGKQKTLQPISLSGGQMSRQMRDVFKQSVATFKKPYILRTLTVMFIYFANMFGCYGFGLWIPELMSRFRKYSESHVPTSVCQLSKPNLTELTVLAHKFSKRNYTSNLDLYDDATHLLEQSLQCENIMDYQGFKDTMTIGGVCLLYNVVGVMVSEYVCEKALPVVSLGVGGLAAAALAWVRRPLDCLVAASLFQASMTTGNIVIVGLVMNAFPSNLSSMAVCMATLAGRLGSICSNLFFGSFMDISCQIPIFLVAALSIGAMVLAFYVKPDKTKIGKLNSKDEKTPGEEEQKENIQSIDLNQVSQYI